MTLAEKPARARVSHHSLAALSERFGLALFLIVTQPPRKQTDGA